MQIFVKPGREPVMLIKVTARVGDDLWILTTGEEGTVIPGPTTKEKAMKYLTEENGWKIVEDAALTFIY